MHFGYARVSSSEQDTTLQLDALRRAGARKVVEEKRAGAGVRRLVLEQLIEQLRPGDVVMVYKLDRLARSMRGLLAILDAITAAGASFRSLTESIDTGTPAGTMMMHMLGAMAQFERSLIAERSIAGQRAAMERGVHCGRSAVLSAKQGARARDLYRSGRYSLTALARQHGCHLSSIKRAIARADVLASPVPPSRRA
jgi:DNA invertase Pin-like site-specific DNA recombinase